MYSVIVVDGDTETVELLKTRVEWNRLGCRLAGTALSITEGLFLVQTEKPDLVITDMRTGGGKEKDLLRVLYERQMEKQTFVIILSACRDFEQVCRAIRYGAALYLTKPLRMEELEEGILWVLDRLENKRQQKARPSGEGQEQDQEDGMQEKAGIETAGLPKENGRAGSGSSPEQAEAEKEGKRQGADERNRKTEAEWKKIKDARAVSEHTLSELKRIRSGMQNYSPFVREALQFIDSHLEQELSLTVLCEELSLSHSYFSKKFKKETGTGYVTYVTMAKMERARMLMEDPRNRANEIAKQLGYYDYSYFFQNFRRYFGCSPREFKSHGRIPE